MNPLIFREYDIRGNAQRDLNDALVQQLGRALGTHWKSQAHRGSQQVRIAVGQDCRLSSPRLFEALTQGIRSTGCHVVDLGMVPTPLMYFAVHHLNLDGGAQITGSHNPPGDNGFKLMSGKDSLYGKDILGLRTRIERSDYLEGPTGSMERYDIGSAYVGFAKGNITLGPHPIPFAVDAGNGASGPIAEATMGALGMDPKWLFATPDGNFPNHHPDPTVEANLADLKKSVAHNKLRFGIAFDGDGDRMGVIDEQGQVIWGDRLLTLFARHILEQHPGAKILGEVKCSQTLYDDIADRGGVPILWKTGHSLIKAKMKEEKALLAGEMSGHIFFADRFFGFDDGLYAALRLIEIMSHTQAPLSELLSDLPNTFTTPEIRVDCADDHKFQVVNKIRDHFQVDHDVITIDGARIQFGNGWGLVRASNTQASLVTRFEAQSLADLEAIQTTVNAAIEAALQP